MSVNLDRIVVRLGDTIIQTVVLDVPMLTVGRAPDTALTLSHPLISRLHAEVRREGDATAIVDLGSANGISVDGVRLHAHQACPLARGAVVQIGPYTPTYLTPDVPDSVGAEISGETVVYFRADPQIQIDAHQRREQVEEIVESDFFHHLREEKARLRRHGAEPPEKDSE